MKTKFRSWINSAQEFTYFENGEYSELGMTQRPVFNWDKAMQYTGLHDKNSVEIYEGDIVRLKNYKSPYIKKYRYEVYYSENDARFRFKNNKKFPENYDMDSTTNYHFEVVGNIYENKELLDEIN